MKNHRIFIFACLQLIFFASHQLQSVKAQQISKPVLVIFHGAAETRNDLAEMAQVSHRMKTFSQVVVIGFNWASDSVVEAAPRMFGSLNLRFPNSSFILLGSREGGLIAEWIATRVKEAEGKITRVITVNSPFDEPAKQNVNATSQSLGPNAGLTATLKEAPVNDLSRTEFVRLWEKGDQIVAQDSALRVLSAGGATTSRLIVRTKPYDPREVIPEMLVQARRDYETKQYNKVVEACRYILKTEPKQAEASSFLGLGLYSSALFESNVATAAELFNESLQHFANAIAEGQYFTFPVAHHHNFGSSFGVLVINDACYGNLRIDKDTVAFVGQADHRFLAPINKVYAQFVASDVGTLHVEVGFDKKNDQEKRKTYNFLPNQIRMSASFAQITPTATIGSNQTSCDERCPLIPQTLNLLINKVRQLPVQKAKPKENIQIDAVHYALREKNKHTGRLSFSESGLQWEELSNNPNPKHNFSISWSALEKVYLSNGLWFTLIYKENKKSRTFELDAHVSNSIEVAKIIYRYSGIAPEL